ncbi:MAG: cellulase family glycosylhydrolase [Bdellovibrionales bacterium]
MKLGFTPKVMAFFVGLFLCQNFPAKASSVPLVRDSFIYGQCIHLGFEKNKAYSSPEDVVWKLAYLGVDSTRDDLFWDIKKANSLQSIPDTMSHIAYGFTHLQARPLLILTGNKRHIPEGQPLTPETRGAFVAYAQKAAQALKELNPIFEVWNEWNLAAKKGSDLGSPEKYVALAKETYPVLKKVNPKGIVLAGAVGEDPRWSWTMSAVRAGLMNYADGLSVHIYNHCKREKYRTGDDVIKSLEELHAKLKSVSPEQDTPVYLTEYGWPNKDGKCGGVSEEKAAANMAQFLLMAPSIPWLKGAWHYELLDRGLDKKNREHHFGQYTYDGRLKPSGCVAKSIWAILGDKVFLEKRTLAKGGHMVVYGKGDERLIGLWQTAGASLNRVKIPKGASTVPLCGFAQVEPDREYDLSAEPILMSLPAQLVHSLVLE